MVGAEMHEDIATDSGDRHQASPETEPARSRLSCTAERDVASAVRTAEESEMAAGDAQQCEYTRLTDRPPTTNRSSVESCDGTFDDIEVLSCSSQTQPTFVADKKLTYELHEKLTLAGKRCATAVSKTSRGVKLSSSWVPSKKLLLEPCRAVSSAGLEKAVDEKIVNEVDDTTKPSQFIKKSLSLKSRRKQHDTTESQVIKDAALQLASEPRVIVSDIKRERDKQSQSLVVTDDEETAVRETIILASDDPPQNTTTITSQCTAAAASTSANGQ